MTERQTDQENGDLLPDASIGTCTGPDCCPPAGGTSRWKVLISLLILGVAGIVLAYSLTKNVDQSGGTTVSRPSAADPVTNTVTSKITKPGACGLTQDTIDHFTEMATGSDAGFILVPGKVNAQTQKVTTQLNAAVAQIESRGNDVVVFTASSYNDDAPRTAELHDSPCVVTIKKGSEAASVSGLITSEKLVQAFVTATRPPSSCSEDCACK